MPLYDVQNEDGEWVQAFNFSPDLYHDEQTLECSISKEKGGFERASDQVKLLMVLFKAAEGKKTSGDIFRRSKVLISPCR